MANTEPYFTPVDDANSSVERTCAKLCVYSGDIHPNAVTKLLGMEPTGLVVAGEPSRPNRLGRAPVGKINGWFLSSEDQVGSKDLRRHLTWLIGKLEVCRDGLRRLQQQEGVRMYVSCPWWSRFGGGGPTLWPEQMQGLAELNLECTIDFADYSEKTLE